MKMERNLQKTVTVYALVETVRWTVKKDVPNHFLGKENK